MKKVLKILICTLIVFIVMQIRIYAADDKLNWDVEKIATYYEEEGRDAFMALSDEVISNWYNKFDAKYSNKHAILNRNDKYGNCYNLLVKIVHDRDPEKYWESTESETYDFNDIESEDDLTYWKPTGGGSNTKITAKAQKILGAVQMFGSITSVIALIIIGIKYIFGSTIEKAKYKETLIPYAIGCILLFGVSNIASVIYKFAINL